MMRVLQGTSLLLSLLILAGCGTGVAVPPTAVPTAIPVATTAVQTTLPEPTVAPTPTPEPAALVNGQPVYKADYERELNQYKTSLASQGVDPESPEGQADLARAREWVLNVLIEQVLTEQAAAAAGVIVSDAEVDAYIQQMIEENGGEEAFQAKLAEWGETYDDAWRQVRAQLIGMAMTQRVVESVPTTTEQVHARHILVDTYEEAERILAQLQAGADFAALAQAYSQDISTRDNGGDLGFFPRGVLVAPEVEEAAFSLQPGQISPVITSTLGYHIIQVIERDPARPVKPEDLQRLQNQAVQEWIESLWAQADVQRFVDTTP